MGFNTTVIVLNDGLSGIENDPDFGKRLAQAILLFSPSKGRVDVCAGNHVNACSVIETHHADNTAVVAVGGNFASVLGCYPGCLHHKPAFQFELLCELAAEMGYHLVKND